LRDSDGKRKQKKKKKKSNQDVEAREFEQLLYDAVLTLNGILTPFWNSKKEAVKN
jgi:hypothetical protein